MCYVLAQLVLSFAEILFQLLENYATLMENYDTYITDNLLKDYEQWLNGFRFLTFARIETYMGYLKVFVRDAEEFIYAENILDSLASIVRYDQLHGTKYALLTLKMLFSVHYDRTISHLPESDKFYFERRKALAKLDELIVSDSFRESIKNVKPASETLISDIRMWRIVQETVHDEIWKQTNNIISEIQEEVDNIFSQNNDGEEDDHCVDGIS